MGTLASAPDSVNCAGLPQLPDTKRYQEAICFSNDILEMVSHEVCFVLRFLVAHTCANNLRCWIFMPGFNGWVHVVLCGVVSSWFYSPAALPRLYHVTWTRQCGVDWTARSLRSGCASGARWQQGMERFGKSGACTCI